MNHFCLRYTPESISFLRNRGRRFLLFAVLLVVFTLSVCIVLCCGITTGNAGLRRILVICLSALGSWSAVALIGEGMLPLLREAAHEEGVLREAEEICSGRIVSLAADHPIPKSISFIPVSFEAKEGCRELKLNARFRKDFPAPGQILRVHIRRGYIVAWEADSQ